MTIMTTMMMTTIIPAILASEVSLKISFEVFMIQAITLLVIAALVAIDQVIKVAVVNRFAAGDSMDILFGLIRIRYVENTGAAFSSMQNQTVF